MGDDAMLPLRERLSRWIEHLAHVLPAQAPIRDFVHHNTLHGFQHLAFTDALAAAQRLTGAAVYLPEARFRELLAEGRITLDDLDAALTDAGLTDLDLPVWRVITRRDVLLATLRLAPDDPGRFRQDWEAREHPQPKSFIFARFSPSTVAVGGEPTADWRDAATRHWSALCARVGREWTRRGLLEHLTGEDVLERVRTVLQRHLAAHLDLGLAAWRNPQRERGFWAAWRACAGVDMVWELDDLPNVRDELTWLPDDPVDVLAEELPRVIADEALWPGYLERLALEIPGWSGMFLWRARNPGRGDGTPVAMVDYLAIRVLLERLLCDDLTRRLTGSPLTLSELHAWFAARPAEFFVRDALRSQALGEDHQNRAARLCRIDLVGASADAEWEALADEIAASGESRAAAARVAAARLEALLALLGLAARDVDGLTAEDARALLGCAASLESLERGHVWLLAYERHYREQIFAALAANQPHRKPVTAPTAQVIFCMDDREEGTRRHLEEVAPAIATFGAVGFFGVAMLWQGVDDSAPSALCPVVVEPVHAVGETVVPGGEEALAHRAGRRRRRLKWREQFIQGTRRSPLAGLLLTALAAPPALVALVAGTLAPGWFGQALGHWCEQFDGRVHTRLRLTAASADPQATPANPQAGFTDDEQALCVGNFLYMIGLAADFAPLVLVLGHGSGSRNNPHLSAYDCGACSGRHGGPNARVLAAMANRPEVRARLGERGLHIPLATWFVAAEHNTCDDGIEWYDLDLLPGARQADLDCLVGQLAEACRAHAVERCRRLASAPPRVSPWRASQHVVGRGHDISQARPELGHATNAAAFIGRREMSRGLFLDRRVFLISYDPIADDDGRIVEDILLAAGPVGAGISLEYYFSTVDNERFGCSSKVTHNIAGLFGVMEGADSDLRTGLPWQMVEIHEAMRLLVVVEQTPEMLSAIVARQPALQELIGNAWIVLAAEDPSTAAIQVYCPRRGWLPWSGGAVLPRVERSADWFTGRHEALPPALIRGSAA
ncbi:MAG: DUF2309 domain-containing protein [Dechloromonas sp.]|nr:DUF2309 domain-containing protein [Candidatus Dechloromonas phosphoritropha]MBP8786214.1 DUF2309 domain-containing protein [Azonexus sp.]MBP9226606.1 DUF2309 domain-containing protein [Azonexus sp.]